MDINTLKTLQQQHKLDPYIQYIRFPKYKNIAPFTKIEFTFPITALVGANGTNKSSLLHALYGAPNNTSVGNFWFSTDIDPIIEGDGAPNCFIYGYFYKKSKGNVEVLKTRVTRRDDPDYWESSRPIVRYGMIPMPTQNPKDPQRWPPIKKNVIFIDFRTELSAFDRYFYNGDFSPKGLAEKKDHIRKKSNKLKEAIESSKKSFFFYKERIIEKFNEKLLPEEVAEVSKILNKNYDEIRLMHHIFFNVIGYTGKISDKNFNYSEAFAGSGEFSVIMLVTKIMRAESHSLILLDEPEVSLHPGAQEKFLEFLANQVKRHKHQVILTTHSPALIRGLPPEAIKVLSIDKTSSKVVLHSQHSSTDEAFIEIGEDIHNKKTVLVEDALAAEIIKKSLRIHNKALLKILEIIHLPGGSDDIFTSYIKYYVMDNRSNILCFLDGDVRPLTEWPDNNKIRATLDEELGKLIKGLCGSEICFPRDGGTQGKDNTIELQRKYLNWCKKYVKYLPGNSNPEEFLLKKLDLYRINIDSKKQFIDLTRESLGRTDVESDPNSQEILQEQCRLINKIDQNDEDLKKIADVIREFIES